MFSLPRNKFFIAIFLLALGGVFGSQWQARYDANYYLPLIKSSVQAPSSSQPTTAETTVPVITPAPANKIDKLSELSSTKPAKVSLMIDSGDHTPESFGQFEAQGQTLFDLTKTVTSQKSLKFVFKDYGDMGVLVTQIGDKTNGLDNKYWQYWVNNEQVQLSANKYLIKAGDIIIWKFSKSNF